MDELIEILTESVKRNGERPLTNKELLFILRKAEIKKQWEQENRDRRIANSWEWHNV